VNHPHDPRSGSTDHAGHDLLLVAEAADRGNVLPAGLIDCSDCRALQADLRALAAATPESALPARPRDLRLSAADAARLRRPAWRRWLADIGTSRDAVTRPLAYGLTTLGLAGLLISAGPNLLSGTAGTVGGAGTAGTAGDAAGDAAEVVASEVPEAAALAPAASGPADDAGSDISAESVDGSANASVVPNAKGSGDPDAELDAGADQGLRSTTELATDQDVDPGQAGTTITAAGLVTAAGLIAAGMALFALRRRGSRRSARR
jgi:hypothetical protein